MDGGTAGTSRRRVIIPLKNSPEQRAKRGSPLPAWHDWRIDSAHLTNLAHSATLFPIYIPKIAVAGRRVEPQQLNFAARGGRRASP
jgi:hypothetical protein